MTDPGTIRAAERRALEEVLRKELEPLAQRLLDDLWLMRGQPEHQIPLLTATFKIAAVVIRRVQGRVTPTTWRHQHYAAGPRALCGIARPAMFLTRQKKHVTCSRCCNRLGIPGWTVEARKGASKERRG